ncbi:UNVERIFIED_CONTAM: hypothetical protein GTU68_055627 [Idotea baltica]|nr:hypothetical protein [Idotea baltica]
MAPHLRAQNAVTLLASYVFYGWWDLRFLALIGAVTAFNYVLAPKAKEDHRFLYGAVAGNLGLLAVFKYLGFFVEEFSTLLTHIGLQANPTTLDILLPVGISFFTFQALSYVVDVARGKTPAACDFLTFATYIALFPQLVAGPIVRAARLLPQLARPRRWSWANTWLGAEQILIGAVLKIVIADRMAPLADRAFENPAALDSLGIALGVLFFAFQIYGDFAGYSLMAIGLGRIMGLSFPVNFRRPYLAQDFSDFWRRWHISLSQWLRDYLYIPLGGNRQNGRRNLMATMMLGGLWHGAGWPFLIWGALHGGYLALGRGVAWPLGRWGNRALVFSAVCLAWVFFRAESLTDAVSMIRGVLAFSGASLTGLGPLIPVVLALFLISLLMLGESLYEDRPDVRRALHIRPVRLGRALVLTLSLPILGTFNGGAFVYFQF